MTLPLKVLSLNDSTLMRARLAEIDLADVALVHFALDVDFAGIAQRHHQRGADEPNTRIELTASPISTSRESTMPSIGEMMSV